MKLLPSHPDYKSINELWNMYAIVCNPHIWKNDLDLEDYQLKEIKESLEHVMELVLEGFSLTQLQKIAESLDVLW